MLTNTVSPLFRCILFSTAIYQYSRIKDIQPAIGPRLQGQRGRARPHLTRSSISLSLTNTLPRMTGTPSPSTSLSCAAPVRTIATARGSHAQAVMADHTRVRATEDRTTASPPECPGNKSEPVPNCSSRTAMMSLSTATSGRPIRRQRMEAIGNHIRVDRKALPPTTAIETHVNVAGMITLRLKFQRGRCRCR